ncbi:MAG: hypothetical protein MOGDAGHF_00741 [Rhodocyclaceae bacterium]|nr:hypothetical protein [Rhodocyclaceae bacterium]
MKRLLPILLALAATAPARAEILEGRVIRISDGDTLVVLDANRKQHKIRVVGIDAPETAQAFGNRARQHLASLAFGKTVTVEWQKQDKYGRIVGKVLTNCDQPGCPLDAGLEQLKGGMAWWYRKYAGEQSAEDRERYERAEQAARDGKLGLCETPILFPLGIGANNTVNPQNSPAVLEPVILVLPRPQIEAGDTDEALGLLQKLVSDPEAMLSCCGRVSLVIDGYNDDPRELFEIAEVRAFIQALDARWPYWYFFLSQADDSIKLLESCCATASRWCRA